MKTKDELIDDVAVDLNMTGLGQPLAGEDQAYLSSRISSLTAELIARNICYLPNLDQIPDGVYEPIMAYMIARLSSGTGGPIVPETEVELIENRIKSATRPMTGRNRLRTDPILNRISRIPFNWTTGQ